MSDEQEIEAQTSTGGEETAVTETPAVEEQTPTEPQEESEETSASTEQTEEESTGEEEQPVTNKRSAEGRIKQLVGERDSLKKQLESYTENSRYVSANDFSQEQQDMLDVNPGEELTVEEYKKRLQQAEERGASRAQSLVQLEMARQRRLDQIDRDIHKVEDDFPQLNPDSDDYDPDLSKAVTKALKQMVNNDINTDVYKEVEGFMKPYQRARKSISAEEKKEAAKQIAESASRPSSPSVPKSGQEGKKTWKDIEKEVGIVRPY